MGNKKRCLTRAEIEARRKNAQKSTGPRTPGGKSRARLNALKQGVTTQAQSFHASMIELGEDPDAFMRLLRGLLAARQPADAVEMMLVEDIAILQWKKLRLDRAQTGVQARNLQALVAERRHRALQVGRDTPDISQAEALRTGLRRAINSPSKFEEILNDLEVVLQWVKQNDIPPDAEQVLLALYGEEPSLRGAQIINCIRELVNPNEPAAEDESLLPQLEMELHEEIRDVVEEYQLYLEEHVEVSRAMRDAALAPTPFDWYVMIRHENALNRMIEQKLKLLESIQNNRRKEENLSLDRPAKLLNGLAQGL